MNIFLLANSSGLTNGENHYVNFKFVDFQNLLIADHHDLYVYDTTTNLIKQGLSFHCEWINGFEVKKADRSLISYDNSKVIRRWCSNIESDFIRTQEGLKAEIGNEDDWESEDSEDT